MPHRKKHTMRWLRSILAVVLSCLLLCSLLCLYVLHVLERTVVETNTALTAYVQKSVDTRLEELHRYSTTIEITHANTLLKNLRELPGTLPAQAYQLSVTLRDFLVTNKLARGLWWAIWAASRPPPITPCRACRSARAMTHGSRS